MKGERDPLEVVGFSPVPCWRLNARSPLADDAVPGRVAAGIPRGGNLHGK